ncbi:MAG: hypothetical protein ACXQTM_07550, partial [Methanosarcinales archaeon]
MLSLIIDPEGSDILSTFTGKPKKNVTLTGHSPEPNKCCVEQLAGWGISSGNCFSENVGLNTYEHVVEDEFHLY